MFRSAHRRSRFALRSASCAAVLALPALAQAQDATTAPASMPAGVAAAPKPAAPSAAVSPKQAREAEDAYLEGAKQIAHKDLEAAEKSFGRALKLNPANQDYVLALASTRQQRVTALVEAAARARMAGDNQRSRDLLAQAHELDPDNTLVTQHMGPAVFPSTVNPREMPAEDIASTLAGPVQLTPKPGTQSFHRRGSIQEMLRTVYSAYGIRVTLDPSVDSANQIRLDLDDVTYKQATRIVDDMAHVFDVPTQPDAVLIAKDTPDRRNELMPQVEETIYVPGLNGDQMSELANLARQVFDVQKITASASTGDILVRSDPETLKLLNATYDDLLDGGSDVLLDVRLYEMQHTHKRDIGATLPTSAGVFSLLTAAQNLISQNQSLIQQAVASGVLTLTGDLSKDIPAELELLIAAGVSGSSQFSDLFLVLGHLSGLPFAGFYISSGSTFNMLLNSSDVRMLDAITLRAGDREKDQTFRAGERYPVITATYNSGITSGLASQLSGVQINGQSAAQLAAQYLGSGAASVPQFQYEDLGLTLKVTPTVQRTGSVSLQVDLKIEALGTGSLNSIPVLNSRQLTSTVSVPVGQTALMATLIDSNELRSIEGVPGLNELPGFQGTENAIEKDSDELLITITPHIVRQKALRIASRPLTFPRVGAAGAQ